MIGTHPITRKLVLPAFAFAASTAVMAWELVGSGLKCPDDLGGFAGSAKEKIRIGLGHRRKSAIGCGVPP